MLWDKYLFLLAGWLAGSGYESRMKRLTLSRTSKSNRPCCCVLFAEQPIKDAVITVPAYFNQAERRAVLHAAQMADLKVLQLINDNTAVALNYGVFRRKDINATAQVLVAGHGPKPSGLGQGGCLQNVF